MTPAKLLLNVAPPVAIILLAWWLAPHASDLPPSLSGLNGLGAYAALALGGVVGLMFRRGRIVFALLTLTLAYLCYGLLERDGLAGFRAHTIYSALCVFVPLNLALLCVLPERGIFNMHGLQRLGMLAAEMLFTLWVVYAPATRVTAWAMSPFPQTTLLAASPIRQLGWSVLVLATIASFATWLMRRAPLDIAFTGVLVAFTLALNLIGEPNAFATYLTAAALIFTIALAQDTFRMAFRDELTGLPSRRDLNERMMGLGRRYTIAMCDVDHFKQFNDTHGHDLGDQVLKMVAAKLAEVSGGGTAYRYGGEEFTVLFPGKDVAHAMPYLEALRGAIESYKIAVRAPDRPEKPEPATRRRGAFRDANTVAVTISIGVAARGARPATPDDVIKAADKALYRAKSGGRNRVSK
ncbi:MAG: GGDEF domain-containing protein [Burkholderiales bacterium]